MLLHLRQSRQQEIANKSKYFGIVNEIKDLQAKNLLLIATDQSFLGLYSGIVMVYRVWLCVDGLGRV